MVLVRGVVGCVYVGVDVTVFIVKGSRRSATVGRRRWVVVFDAYATIKELAYIIRSVNREYRGRYGCSRIVRRRIRS